MGKSKKNKGKNSADNNRQSLLVISCVVLVFLGGMFRNSMKLEERLAMYNARAEELEERLESEKTRTAEIDALKKYMMTDEYIEETAREKLGLVKSGEIVFLEGEAENNG